MGGVLCRGFLSSIRINIRCSGDGNCSHRCTFCFFEFATPIFFGTVCRDNTALKQNRKKITNQPVHIRTLAVSASSTATSAVNLLPKPLALWTSPLVWLSVCLCVCVL